MRNMRTIVSAVVILVSFVAVQLIPADAAIRRAEKRLTLQEVIGDLENGGKYKVTQKKGAILKLEKSDTYWQVDYLIHGVSVVDTIPGVSDVDVSVSYIAKVDTAGNVEYILGTKGVVRVGEGDFKDTRVIGAEVMASAPDPAAVRFAVGEEVTLLFVSKASTGEKLKKKVGEKIKRFKEKREKKNLRLPPKVDA